MVTIDELLSDECVLAVVCRDGEWGYYIGPVDVWVMDWDKWRREYVEAGHSPPTGASIERAGVRILNEETAGRALQAPDVGKVDEEILREALRRRIPRARWDEVSNLFPVVLIDFDVRRVKSVYSEPLRLERYVPHGWAGFYEEFYDDVPLRSRYWIDGERNYLSEVLGR